VIGAGPAGLEAARILAERGHDVVLHEREDALGGRLRISAEIDPEVARLVAWFADAAERAGVDIRLGSDATAETLGGTADAFLVATGSVRGSAGVSGAEGATPAEAFLPLLDAPAGARVAVVGSDVIGVKVAEALALAGHRTTLLERGGFAPEMGLPRRWRAADALARCSAERVRVKAIDQLTATTVEATTEDGPRHFEADHVIWSEGLVPESGLAAELREAGGEVHAVAGDQPVYLEAAILEAARIAGAL